MVHPDSQPKQSDESSTLDKRTSSGEWLVAIIGFLLTFGTVAYLLYQAIAGSDSPPDIIMRVGSIKAERQDCLVRFKADNEGGRAAEGVVIKGELRQEDRLLESSETTLDYIPGHSTVRGGLFFRQDPRQHALQIRAQGYEEP